MKTRDAYLSVLLRRLLELLSQVPLSPPGFRASNLYLVTLFYCLSLLLFEPRIVADLFVCSRT
jgi:hypothetical protein